MAEKPSSRLFRHSKARQAQQPSLSRQQHSSKDGESTYLIQVFQGVSGPSCRVLHSQPHKG